VGMLLNGIDDTEYGEIGGNVYYYIIY
jgi:hypothetical protein